MSSASASSASQPLVAKMNVKRSGMSCHNYGKFQQNTNYTGLDLSTKYGECLDPKDISGVFAKFGDELVSLKCEFIGSFMGYTIGSYTPEVSCRLMICTLDIKRWYFLFSRILKRVHRGQIVPWQPVFRIFFPVSLMQKQIFKVLH